jgi:hypothetical protein
VKLKRQFIEVMTVAVVLIGANPGLGEIQPAASLAMDLYGKGEFGKAATEWERAVRDSDLNGHLFYNLGLAHYKEGQKGEAMAAFLAARARIPRDPDVRLAIERIENSLAAQINAVNSTSWQSTLMPFLAWASWLEFAATGAAILTAAFLLLTVSLVLRNGRQILRGAGLILTMCASLLLILAWIKAATQPQWGAVVVDQTEVLSGPNPKTNSVIFRLEEGSPIKIQESLGPWTRIELADGKRGWLPSSHAKFY